MIFNDRDHYHFGHALDREYSGNASAEFLSGFSGNAYLSKTIEEPWGNEDGGQQEQGGQGNVQVKAHFHGGGHDHGDAPKTYGAKKLTTKQLGQTISEGRGLGTFVESLPAAIRTGANAVELSLNAGELGTGPDYYTKEKLQEIRDIAKANQVELASVHTPVQIVGNLSGFDNRSGFSDETRHLQLTEVKKAIQFNAETAQGGAVVVHTGEFQRTMFDKPWATNSSGQQIFRAYEEEQEKFVAYIVDDRTGQIINTIRKTQFVYEPVYKTAKDFGLDGRTDKKGRYLQADDWVDIDGNWIDPTSQDALFNRVPEWDAEKTRFKVKKLEWKQFEERAEKWNQDRADQIRYDPDLKMTPEEMFIRTRMENQELQARGSSLFHGRSYNHELEAREALVKARDYYQQLDKNLPEDEKWKLLKMKYPPVRGAGDFIPGEMKSVLDIIDEQIKSNLNDLRYAHEAVAAADAQAETVREEMRHMKAVEKYAKKKSAESYADAALYAYDTTKARGFDKPIFVSPENIFPEHGFGSHPDELIELVDVSRKEMAKQLMEKRHMSEERAKKIAEEHIKATLDTEHIGLWKKHFIRKDGENEEQFTKRFNGWYMDEVKKLEKSGIIGHIHIADGFGYGHANLPPGAGTFPVVEAVNYLRSKGYKGAYLSEGYGDAPRILTQAWKAFGSPIYSAHGPIRPGPMGIGPGFHQVQYGYFGHGAPPNYIFGAYSPSNEWTFWSQTPME